MRSQPASRGDLHEADRALTQACRRFSPGCRNLPPTPRRPSRGGVARPGNGSCRNSRRCASENSLLSAPGERGGRCGVLESRALGTRVRESGLLGALPRARRPSPGPTMPTSANSRTGIRPIAEKRRFQDLARTTLCPATPIHRPRRGLPQRTVPRTRGQPPSAHGPDSLPCQVTPSIRSSSR